MNVIKNFEDRIQESVFEYIDLLESELEIYRGAGLYLAGVDGTKIVRIFSLGQIGIDELESGDYTKFFNDLVLPWIQEQPSLAYYHGIMSCSQFCEPVLFEPSALGFAKISRRIHNEML